MSFAQIVRKLDEIEAEMKRIGYWQAEPPAEPLAKLAAGEIGYLDPGFSFEQYLQLVFLPAARQRLKDKDLPRESNVGVVAMRQYDYHSHVPEAEDCSPSILNVFPRRPLKLSYLPSVRTGWWELASIHLFVGALIADLAYIPPSIIDDLAIGGSGTLAQQARIAEGGKCNIKAFVMICDFDVDYRTADGAAREKSLHYLALGMGMDDLGRLQVRYDPANPDRISTNWGRDMLINRIIAEIIAVVLLVLFVGGVVLSYLSTFRRRRSLLAMAGNPRPVTAAVRVTRSKKFATVHFTWTDPETNAMHRDPTRLPGRTEPFWLDGQRKTVLALAGPDGRAHLLDQTLGPAVLTDEERAALGRARAGSVPPGASAAG